MKPISNAIVRILISDTDPKLSKIRKYIFRDKAYNDWIQFLQFGLEKLLTDDRISKEEQGILAKNRKIIRRFNKVKRPANYLRVHLIELKPLIEILLNYE